MLQRSDLKKHQRFAVRHIIDNPYCGLFLDPGIGKTVISLTAIDELINNCFETGKWLIIAPINVARMTWSNELKEWAHLNDLKLSKVLGTEAERIKGLKTKADIHIINVENVQWLVSYYGDAWPFTNVIVDESSNFKSHDSKRFKCMKMVRPYIDRFIILTGTPATKSLIDLWPQIYLLDGGERLGKNISAYRSMYFNEAAKNGNVVYSYSIKPEAEEKIYEKIEDICISMSADDYLELPERIDNFRYVELNRKARKQYDEFEREQILEFEEEDRITAANAAVLSGKLLQFANGAVYDEIDTDEHLDNDNPVRLTDKACRAYHVMHNDKLDALEELIDEINGKPALLFYTFQHDFDRIKKRFKFARKLKTEQDFDDWNKGKIRLACVHPKSAAHGLNLQKGGHHVIWYGLPWSLELYIQANARLHRQGQRFVVFVHHLIAEGTIDEAVLDRLRGRRKMLDALMRYVKAKTANYRK